MKDFIALSITLIFPLFCNTQDLPDKKEIVAHFGFEQHSVTTDDEEIIFYSYQKGTSQKTKLVMFLQGSDPSPQFGYSYKDGDVRKHFWHWGEYKDLTDEYIYVIVEKIGFEGLIHADTIPEPLVYIEKNSLDNRVFRADAVLDHITGKQSFQKVIVYGHSEGAPVAAKLGTVNEDITHLGFWCGNALPDFYDFILENRIMYYGGKISAEESQKNIDETINIFVNEIAKDTGSVAGGGYTNLRWWSYAEPPINNLLKIDIPLYVLVATEDKSAPIESSYLIPLEFARLGKKNLTYEVCVGCDHGFFVTDQVGKRTQKWKGVFQDFIKWTNEE